MKFFYVQKDYSTDEKFLKSDRRYSAFMFVPVYIFLVWLLLFHLDFIQPVVERNISKRHYETVYTGDDALEDSTMESGKTFGTVVVADEDGRFDLNSASETLLEKLPGIGPAKARKITQVRAEMNGFRSVGDLLNVDGIGEKTFDKIKDYLYISE